MILHWTGVSFRRRCLMMHNNRVTFILEVFGLTFAQHNQPRKQMRFGRWLMPILYLLDVLPTGELIAWVLVPQILWFDIDSPHEGNQVHEHERVMMPHPRIFVFWGCGSLLHCIWSSLRFMFGGHMHIVSTVQDQITVFPGTIVQNGHHSQDQITVFPQRLYKISCGTVCSRYSW
jgi:hypothetical protein